MNHGVGQRRTIRALGLAALVLLTACAPSAPAPAQPAAPTGPKRAAKQVLRISYDALDPTASPEASTRIPPHSAMFDALMGFDDNLKLQPAAAERYEALPNGTGWRFFLRNDLTFSNGDKLTAADVDFTMKNAIAQKLQVRTNLAAVTDSRVVDERTVDLLTPSLDISILYNSPYLFILPKKYYESVGKEGYAAKPIGSGPYELGEYQPGVLHVYKLRSTAHPYRKPNLTEIQWRSVPDTTAAINGLRTGDLDVSLAGFTPDQADTARQAGINVVTTTSSGTWIVVDKNSNEKNNTPLLDKRVRQALNYAIDKEALSKTVFKGFAKPSGQLSGPGTLMWDDANKPFPFDQAKAKQLLAEAGYPNGFKLAGGLDFSSTYTGATIYLPAIQDYWKQIGVEVPLNSHEIGTYLDRLFGRNGRTRNELMVNNSADGNGMFVIGRTFYLCSLPPETRLVCVPEFERQLNLAYAELDETKRRAAMQAANKAFIEELPIVFLFLAPSFKFASPKVGDLKIDGLIFYNFDSAVMLE